MMGKGGCDMNKKHKLQETIETFEEKKERNVEDYLRLFCVVESVLRQGSGLVWSDVEDAIQKALKQDITRMIFTNREKATLRNLIRERYNDLVPKKLTRNEEVFLQLEAIHNRVEGIDIEDVEFEEEEKWILQCLVSEKYNGSLKMGESNLTNISELHGKFEQFSFIKGDKYFNRSDDSLIDERLQK